MKTEFKEILPVTTNGFAEEKQALDYEQMPCANEIREDMRILETNRNEFMVYYRPDIPYIAYGEKTLKLQLIMPTSPEGIHETFPCLLHVVGSAWETQDMYELVPALSKIAARGFAVALVEYRSSDEAIMPAQILDVKSAIRYIKKNAEEYNIDRNNIFLSGDSSGGHTAVMAAVTMGIKAFEPECYSEYTSEVNAVIDLYGPTNVAKMAGLPSGMNHIMEGSPERKIIGGAIPDEENTEFANPLRYITKDQKIVPILIVHGNKDRKVHFNQSILLRDALHDAGKEYTFYKLLNADHGKAPFWTTYMVDRYEEFLRRNFC